MATVRERAWTHKGVTKCGWEVRYLDPDTGKRRSKTFKMKKEADAFRRKVEREIEDGMHTAEAARLPVSKIAEKFIRTCEQRWRDGQIGQRRYRSICSIIDMYILPAFGSKSFDSITHDDLERWWREMDTNHHLGLTTRDEYLITLKMMEEYAVKRGYTKKTPAAAYRKEKGSFESEAIKTFSTEEIGLILADLGHRPPRITPRNHLMFRCIVTMAVFCGMRFGEIVGLRAENADIEGRLIRVRNSLTAYGELKAPKTKAGIRDVPMPDVVAALIEEWRAVHMLPNERGLLFTTSTGGWVKHGDFYGTWWQPLMKRVGLWDEGGDQRHFHALRHFAASWMIANGLPLTDTAQMLGHKTFDMTLQVYAHPTISQKGRLERSQRMANSLIGGTVTPPARLSVSEFATTHGVTPTAVRRWKAVGLLTVEGELVVVAPSDAALQARGFGRFRPASEPMVQAAE